jgi:hypothetical protein
MEQPFVRSSIGSLARKLRRRATDVWNAEKEVEGRRWVHLKNHFAGTTNEGRKDAHGYTYVSAFRTSGLATWHV